MKLTTPLTTVEFMPLIAAARRSSSQDNSDSADKFGQFADGSKMLLGLVIAAAQNTKDQLLEKDQLPEIPDSVIRELFQPRLLRVTDDGIDASAFHNHPGLNKTTTYLSLILSKLDKMFASGKAFLNEIPVQMQEVASNVRKGLHSISMQIGSLFTNILDNTEMSDIHPLVRSIQAKLAFTE